MSKCLTLKLVLTILIFEAGNFAIAQESMISAPKIVQSLNKDIVLDATSGGNRVNRQATIDLQVQFAFNSSDLLPAGKQQLDELALALNSKALMSWGFELAGHTDRIGSADYNLKLSFERAMVVKNYLVTYRGLSPNRLIPLGLGFSQLANPADPSNAVNRRVEVRKVAIQINAAPTSVAPSTPSRIGGALVPTP
jgi:outer membrane protein OmpA-like peptidoglycan-associated protein